MNNKANFASNIIMFVLGLVIIAGVLFFGYRIIDNIQQERCDVQRVQFGTQLQQYIDRNKGWGSNRVVTLDLPCEAEYVCFVGRSVIDAYAQGESPDIIGGPTSATTLISTSVASQDPTNVFTIQDNGNVLPVERFSGQSAAVESGVQDATLVCVQGSGGQVRVRMQGTGNIVQVSQG